MKVAGFTIRVLNFSSALAYNCRDVLVIGYKLEFTTGNAESFKEDGNVEFKKKRYDIAIDNYTAGIKFKCPDKALNAVLYTNRAAAQFHKRRSHRGSKIDIVKIHRRCKQVTFLRCEIYIFNPCFLLLQKITDQHFKMQSLLINSNQTI